MGKQSMEEEQVGQNILGSDMFLCTKPITAATQKQGIDEQGEVI